jgi:hypothetical protein
MKNYTNILVLILALIPGLVYSQSREEIFRKDTKITWLGIDFSEARYFGEQGTVDAYEMKAGFYKINHLILAESEKYNLAKAFYKRNLTNHITASEAVNNMVDESKIVSYNSGDYYRLKAEDIQEAVKRYDLSGVDGICLVFIMEGMNKTLEQGAMWVTFFNASDRTVLLTERLTGKAGGFGFRNHWASTIQNVLKEIQSRRYQRWSRI